MYPCESEVGKRTMATEQPLHRKLQGREGWNLVAIAEMFMKNLKQRKQLSIYREFMVLRGSHAKL